MEIYVSLSPFGAENAQKGIRLAKETGCAGVSVPLSFLDAGLPLSLFDRVPIRMVAVSWRSDRRADLKAALARAGAAGAWGVNLYALMRPGEDAAETRKALVADVNSALSGAEPAGPRLLLENGLEKAPGLAASLDAWLETLRAVGSLRFLGTFDPANFVASGDAGAVDRIASDAAPYIGHVHAKGVLPFDAELHGREPFRGVWEADGRWMAAPTGEGMPDWVRVLDTLRHIGYRGALTVEPFDREEPIRRAIACLRRAAACVEIGLEGGR